MKRAILGALMMATTAILLTNQGCKSTGIGDPCTPEQEYLTTFSGFSEKEVNFESKSFQCETRLCLVNHFRGRVSCPYGQDSDGKAPTTAAEGESEPPADCVVPGTTTKIEPNLPAPLGNCVASQCEDRKAADAVYCSCRCANTDGKTDDGSVYCECPQDGFECVQLAPSIGGANQGLTGGFCIKKGTQFDEGNNCQDSLDKNDPRKCIQ